MFFNWLNHIMQICILLVPKSTHKCTQWPPIFFISFIAYKKYAEFYAYFKSVKLSEKSAPIKNYLAYILKVSSIEEDKL